MLVILGYFSQVPREPPHFERQPVSSFREVFSGRSFQSQLCSVTLLSSLQDSGSAPFLAALSPLPAAVRF